MLEHHPYDLVTLQRFMASLDEDTRAAFEDAPQFIQWFDHEALSVFRGKTPRQLVMEGRMDDLSKYVATIMQGLIG